MKLLKQFLLLGTMCALATGCADESPFGGENSGSGTGGIKLSLTASDDVSSSRPNVRAVNLAVVTPPIDKFQIRLSKTDGSYAKTWSSLTEFSKETEFTVGIYELEAFYGDPDAQGVVKKSEAGYEHAYYYGKTEEIIVREDESTNVSIKASLANAIVVVEYTDEYQKYFDSWETTLKTSGVGDVTLGGDEGMCYVAAPGEVDIVMDAVLQNGKKIFLNPAEFHVEPQHLYKVKYDVFEGQVGDMNLAISFDDETEKEPDIVINLDGVGSTEAPKVVPSGFEIGEEIEMQSGVPLTDKELKYSILAPGGIKSAKLNITNINSSDNVPSYLKTGSIDLCSPELRDQLLADGMITKGFYDENSTMAFLDITAFVKLLPAGSHEIDLQVTDKGTQTNETVKFKLNSIATNSAIVSSTAMFGDGYAEIIVSYDGAADPTKPGNNPFSFLMYLPSGTASPVEILSIESAPDSRATYVKKNYKYTVTVPNVPADEYRTELDFNGAKVEDTHIVKIQYPTYNVEYDAFATKVFLRILGIDDTPSKRSLFNNRLQIYVDGVKKTGKIDENTGIITLLGIESNKILNIQTTLKVSSSEDDFMTTNSVNTENINAVPNGDFEELTQKYNETMNQGGTWRTSALDLASNYQNTASYVISEATGWATCNDKTMSGNTKNTWFCQPSVFNSTLTYKGNCVGVAIGTGKTSETPEEYKDFGSHKGSNSMVIRNVGWDPNGNVPKVCSKSSNKSGVKGTDEYYNFTVPVVSNHSVGKMFLGTYQFSNNIETYDEGIEFNSRPSRLTGWYKYRKDRDSGQADNGIVKICLYSDSEKIAEGEAKLEPSGEFAQFNIDLNYSLFSGKKATKLCIMVASSEFSSNLLAEETANIKVSDYNSRFESYQHGATLVVDDFEFIYE